MIKGRVLVSTDFSKQSDIAFKQSVFFSKRAEMEIFLLHVIPKKNTDEAAIDHNIENIQKRFEIMINEAKNYADVKISYRIEYGKIIPKILETAEEIKPNFMFIGTDTSETEASSIALKLINKVDYPIIVFTGRFNKLGCENIVLPLDLTKETKQKVDLTVKLAKIYGATVHIVSVINFTDNDRCERIEQQIEEVKLVFNKQAINVVTKIIKKNNDVEIMADAINNYADEVKSDLIVIMTRQETKIQKIIIGSMATKLIRKANAPILCVNPKY